ncbi:MAG TPA: NUDIX hydrolase [Opitutaceae bacterium]|nr:NUDIX hydrolase [Opitutaceae bacterium]
MREGERTLVSTRILDLKSVRFRHPVRGTERDFTVAHAPDWVNVVAHTPAGEIVLVRQFRFGANEFSLELPGGVIENGEDPVFAGVRELAEETGYGGGKVTYLGSVNPNPAIQDNKCHFVLVEGAVPTTGIDWDDDEEIQVSTAPVKQVLAWAREGVISHALSVAALMLFEGASGV